jgi:hypothetical protein
LDSREAIKKLTCWTRAGEPLRIAVTGEGSRAFGPSLPTHFVGPRSADDFIEVCTGLRNTLEVDLFRSQRAALGVGTLVCALEDGSPRFEIVAGDSLAFCGNCGLLISREDAIRHTCLALGGSSAAMNPSITLVAEGARIDCELVGFYEATTLLNVFERVLCNENLPESSIPKQWWRWIDKIGNEFENRLDRDGFADWSRGVFTTAFRLLTLRPLGEGDAREAVEVARGLVRYGSSVRTLCDWSLAELGENENPK